MCLKQICLENDGSPARGQVHRGFVILNMTEQPTNAQVVVWTGEPLLGSAGGTTWISHSSYFLCRCAQ